MAKRKAESATSEAKSTKKPTRQQTAPSISICVPSSVISSKNAYNLQQKTMIAYQIAKASLIYDVAEIIVLTELTTKQEGKGDRVKRKRKILVRVLGRKLYLMTMVKMILAHQHRLKTQLILSLTKTQMRELMMIKMTPCYWLVYYNFSSLLPI